MKRSIYSIVLDGGTNSSQKREVFKGSVFYDAFYENNQLTVQFELGTSNELEQRHFAVYDTRQAIPDKFLPAFPRPVTHAGITLLIFDVTHERVSSNERDQDLVSFGNYLLSEERKERMKNSPSEVTRKESMNEVCHADIENWKHNKMKVVEVGH